MRQGDEFPVFSLINDLHPLITELLDDVVMGDGLTDDHRRQILLGCELGESMKAT